MVLQQVTLEKVIDDAVAIGEDLTRKVEGAEHAQGCSLLRINANGSLERLYIAVAYLRANPQLTIEFDDGAGNRVHMTPNRLTELLETPVSEARKKMEGMFTKNPKADSRTSLI